LIIGMLAFLGHCKLPLPKLLTYQFSIATFVNCSMMAWNQNNE